MNVNIKPRKWKNTKGLPLPRLELFWEKENENDPNWLKKNCYYGLVLPIRATDIRQDEEESGTLWVSIGATSVTGGASEHQSPDSESYGRPVRLTKDNKYVVNCPFRDGAHASWDASVLKLPVWVVCEDTFCTQEEAKID